MSRTLLALPLLDSPGRTRNEFRHWLLRHRCLAMRLPLPALLMRFGKPITPSAAYRVALAEGLRGHRRNRSRYDSFWNLINWALPDSALEEIWGVTRGNLQQRRVRMQARQPRFDARVSSAQPDYLRALSREIRRARAYRGARPH